jgi:hypothetical protein
MSQIELRRDDRIRGTGGDGPTPVLLHGLLMDASLWDDVIADSPTITDAWRRRRRSGRTATRCTPTRIHPAHCGRDAWCVERQESGP